MTEQTQSKITDVIKALMTAFGAWLLGRNLFGQEITENGWQEFSGVVLAVTSMVWSVLSKTLTIEMVQSTVRQFITFAGGLLLAYGTLQTRDLVLILALVPTISPLIYSWLSKIKSNKLAKGDITIQQLKK